MALTAAEQAQLNEALSALTRDRRRADRLAADLVRVIRTERVPFVYWATRLRRQDYNAAVRHLDRVTCAEDWSLVQFNFGYCLLQTGDYLRRALRMLGAEIGALNSRGARAVLLRG